MRSKLIAVGVVVALLSFIPPASPSRAASRLPHGEWIEMEALWSDRFVESIGVNVHLNWHPRTSYVLFWPQLKQALLDLGVRHVRTHYYDSGDVVARSQIRDLARNHGILTLLNPVDAVDPVGEVMDLGVDCLSGVEGLNEPDGHWLALPEPATGHLRRLYEGITRNPATRHLPVLHCPLADPVSSPRRYGEAMSNCTTGNIHPYAGSGAAGGPSGSEPGQSLDDSIALIRRYIVGDKPIWATECGYHNGVRHRPGHEEASESAVAKLLPRMLFVHAIKGIERSYIYQLADESPDEAMNFGLVRYDGSPKPVFHSLRNLISLLSDRGAGPHADRLRVRFTGEAQGVWAYLLNKRDGRLYLALWQEVDSYDSRSASDVHVPAKRVVLEFGRRFSRMRIFRPLESVSPVMESRRQGPIPVDVPDHLLIVELTP